MIIRKFKESDSKALSSLIQKTLLEVNIKDSPKFAIEELHDEYGVKEFVSLSKKRDIYVAIMNNLIVGSVANEKNLICTLFVKHNLRGKGIGTELLRYIEEIIKKSRYPNAKLVASLSAQSFFKKMGYKETKKQFDRRELTGIFMEKYL